MFDQLAALDISRTTWIVKVRVTRMWPSLSSTAEKGDSLKGYNMILLDDDNCHVQAFVYADQWKAIAKDMVEGGLYIISNFYTREATGSLRPTSSKIIINFSNSTTIEKLKEDDFMIPMNKFEFVDLSELFRIASGYENPDSPELSTDVIGVVEDYEKVKVIKTMYGDRNIVKFRITDGRYSHKVTVWGQLATDTNDLFVKIAEEPIIAIITSSKLKIYKSTVQISTLPSSKIYFNLENDFVTAMRMRLEEEGYKVPTNVLSSPVPTPVVPVTQTLTLRQLGEKTNTEDVKRNYKCQVKISLVEETGAWWYNSCLKCQGEATKFEGRFKCCNNNCTNTIPVAEKRYKFVVLAGDSTEAYNFIVLDRAAKRMLGQTATKMICDNIQTETKSGYPAKIKEIAGKEYTFTVQISEENVLLKSKIFNVTDAYDTNVLNSSSSQGASSSFATSSFSANLVDLENEGETPGSAKSVTKKIKTET